MRFVGVIHTAQFELNAFALKRGMNPARRQDWAEHVTHRRKINQVDAAVVLPNIPGMRVAEDIRFDLLSGPQDFKESGGVLQSDVSAEARVVMDRHQRGFVEVGIERACEPIQLSLSQQTGRRKGPFKGVEHEPIRQLARCCRRNRRG